MDKPQTMSNIYDLAQATGYSISTISRVLNQRGRISKKTRLEVLAAARAAGFKPRASVRRNTVAIVLDRSRFCVACGYHHSILSHLILGLEHHDMAVEIYADETADRLGTRFVDAVVSLTWSDETLQIIRELSGVPVVAINRTDVHDLSLVTSDHQQAGELAARHLFECGHRRIAFLAPYQVRACSQRLEAMVATAADMGLDDVLITPVLLNAFPSLDDAVGHMLTTSPTALFISCEDLNHQVLHALRSRGCSVPGDLSVIGMEVPGTSGFHDPPLTCVAQPFERLARTALEILSQQLSETGPVKPMQRVLDNQLIVRQSVRRAG